MPGVRQDHAAAQLRQVGGGDHALSAGDGDDDVGAGEGLVAIRSVEAVEVCAQLEHWVALHHGDLGVPAAEVCCHAAAHRAVPKHGDALAVDRFVGDAQVRLQGALPHPVFVLGELLDGAVVDDQDRHVELVAQRLEAHATRGRLFGTTAQRWVRVLQIVHVQVTTVVEDQVGLGGHDLGKVRGVHGGIFGRLTNDRGAMRAESLHGVGLRGVEVAGRDELRATRLQGEQQGNGLRLQVNAGANGEAGERLGAGELFGNATQQLRLLGDPINACALHGGSVRLRSAPTVPGEHAANSSKALTERA